MEMYHTHHLFRLFIPSSRYRPDISLFKISLRSPLLSYYHNLNNIFIIIIIINPPWNRYCIIATLTPKCSLIFANELKGLDHLPQNLYTLLYHANDKTCCFPFFWNSVFQHVNNIDGGSENVCVCVCVCSWKIESNFVADSAFSSQ